ncbi:hypothetical protein VOLCADRAFT_120602 [Volvox carteri f. nagariensis]|uniref:Clathrin adaptor alpha/beta/gamma-adaptin appendage Ig-like subdomain domain-containing protein n=1 Tax=Volvox carteri f. nagariensis TaxID=3068 RepID=D8TPF9_VOLCA|nr:uncharacterized protein VOLCADRAFT_120602 [Volvox carteri f. nagariensis]EFJ50611.1 hypothetical protein VOLCADRAFT_120602 [Volvox carteri f. nagariensis]|eukprot:XP_002948204.1 hypothetical protein VOLCADRAFT_120602 [Volvox carteri f. nagariensis]
MRQAFISDIRACQNKEQEQKRVEKELAKIRAKFGEDKALSGYDRRKYIWKLLYIYMLGFDIDFGHKQACDLIPMPKYSDKQVGYMACSLLLQENDEFLRLAINAIHMDLTSRNEAFQALALSFVGNIGGAEMAEALTVDVLKLLTSGATRPLIKKRASLCLLRLLRKTPPDAPLMVSADTFSPAMGALLEERDLGLLLCAVTLLHGVVQQSGTSGYETCQGRVIKILERLVRERERIPPEYLYYGIPSPWLQARCLRALQLFPPPDSTSERKTLHDVLQNIIAVTSGEAAKNANPNKANALNAILFEALALALHHAAASSATVGGDSASDKATLDSCLILLGKYLAGKDANAKYLALDSLARLSSTMPEVLQAARGYRETVMASLKDPDVSIRRRALDLLFAMCDAHSATQVVSELLKYLVTADFSVREQLVLKIAILAEKYAPSMQWYMDVVLQLLERSGDFVSDEIWHRAVQMVTNNPVMQEYAARNVAEALKRGAAHESMVCTAAYILGEYGRLIRAEVPPAEQFRLLFAAFPAALPPTKGLLMTALLKIYLLDPSNATLSREVRDLFERYKRFMDAELQQRATEYLQALASNPAAAANYILPMPAWTIRESSLMKRLQGEVGAGGAGDPGGSAADLPSTNAGANPAPLLSVPMPSGPGATPAAADLLSLDSGSAAAAAAATAPANGVAAAAAPPPPPPKAPVDLLSDLFGDVISSSSAPTPAVMTATAPPPAAAQPAPSPALPFPSVPSAPVGVTGGPVPTAPGIYPGAMPGFPGMVPSAAAAFPSMPYAAVGTANPFAANPFAAAAAAPPPPAHLPAAVLPAAAPLAAPVAAGADPFGDSHFAPPPPPPPVAVTMPPQPPPVDPPRPVGDVEAWYSALILKERGILYEDQYLQVGLQSQYTRGRGTVVLYLGNKHASAQLTGVALAVAAPSPGVQVIVAPVPMVLETKQQVQVPLTLTCLAPFAEPPVLSLSYALRMPTAMHKFMVPEPHVPKETFFEHWRSAPPHCKAQEMVDRGMGGPLSPESVQSLMRLFHLGVEHGYLDPSPHNEAGAAYWGCGPQEAQRSVICCCRVEANPQNRAQFRVTVVSEQPELAKAVHSLLVAQIHGAPASQ